MKTKDVSTARNRDILLESVQCVQISNRMNKEISHSGTTILVSTDKMIYPEIEGIEMKLNIGGEGIHSLLKEEDLDLEIVI